MQSFQLKRIQSEIKDLKKDPPSNFIVEHLENDIRIWHFTFFGLAETDYEGGIYHGTLELDSDYPMKPPNIYFMTPNGRFQTNTKICLNITKFHQENWDPSINIRTIINAIINHFPIDDINQGIGSLKLSKSQRQIYAKKSIEFKCDHCGIIKDIVKSIQNHQELSNPSIDNIYKKQDLQNQIDLSSLDQLEQNKINENHKILDKIYQSVINQPEKQGNKQSEDEKQEKKLQKKLLIYEYLNELDRLKEEEKELKDKLRKNEKIEIKEEEKQQQLQINEKDKMILRIHDLISMLLIGLVITVICFY